MQVEITASALQSEGGRLALLAVFALGLLGRHRVVVEDDDAFRAWRAALPDDLAEELQLAAEQGLHAIAIGAASDDGVRVVARASRWDRSLPELDPEDALALLQVPLRIFVENARNDRAFLLAFADPDQRRRLEHAEQRGWLVYTGGGIGEIQKALETTMSPSSWFVAHRTWALCDSDAATAGSPGRASTTITHLLRRLERRMGRPAGWAGTALARRAIENYAPPDRVRSWAMTLWSAPAEEVDRWMSEANARLEGGGCLRPLPKVGTPKRRILGALALRSLPPQQRAHLDLKRGKEGTDREQWEKIPEPARTWLDHGLGAGFAAEFYPRFRDLEDDSGELRPLLDQLLRRL